MEILKAIQDNNYFISDDKDIVCTDNKVASRIDLSSYTEITQTINVDRNVVSDACFLDKSKFVKKYEKLLLPKAPLSAERVYRMLRHVIVDDKIPIIGKKSSRRSAQIQVQSKSRKDQVKELLDQKITSPSEIAKILGTNASYVQRLIKQINGQ